MTALTDGNGRLRWKAPKGKWTIVRIGYTTTGEVVAAAPDAGIGLDCDKLSKEALDRHFDLFINPLMQDLKPWCGTTLEALVIDSWEAGKQNWTENLPAFFKAKRGYDIMPYMLAVTGRVIGSKTETERFLWDFRRTHTDMFIENYVEHFKKRIGRHGLKYAGEAYGDGNFESLEMAARQDYPMSEFWTHYIYGNITTTMLASSTAHVWNRPIVACECYTGTPFNSKFTEHPYGMKALGDYIMTAGVNRFVYHATTHQPYAGSQPGNMMTMGPFGTHLDRTSTWADQFAALNLYNARCAYMLQQGKYVADILYLKDESISSGVANYNMVYPATPYGYRWDIAGTEALHKRLSVRDGKIFLPDGMTYNLLVVAPMERTSPETLQRIIELVEQGMTVVLAGDKPVGYLGLSTQKNEAVKTLAEKLWGNSTLGKGHIIHKEELTDVLNRLHIAPDFAFTSQNKDAQIHFIHRKSGTDDVYFVTNHRRRPEQLTVSCRVKGRVPQLWDAETGATGIPVPYKEEDGITKLNIRLQESGSIFIVFREGTDKQSSITEVQPIATQVHGGSGDFDFSPEHDFRSTFSLSLWAKPETFAANGRGYLLYPSPAAGGNADDKAMVGISMGQNGVRVYERNKRMSSVLEYKGAVEGWTHVALVYKNGIPQLYLNGVLAGTGRASKYDCHPAIDVPQAEEQYIGSFEGDHTRPEVFDCALSPQAVAAMAEAGVPAPRCDGEVWKTLSDNWEVSFPKESKAPAKVVLPSLYSLHKHTDFNIRHFSGTAIYRKELVLTHKELTDMKGKRLTLDLGRVENMAEVSINGSSFALIWKAPYQLDVTGMLKEGKNQLLIKVTNLYPNRIIGDEHLPEKYEYDEYGRIRQLPAWYIAGDKDERERVLFLPWKHYKQDDPLLESGLLGPVRLTKH